MDDTDSIRDVKPGELPDEDAASGKFWDQLAANLRFATIFGHTENDLLYDDFDLEPDEDYELLSAKTENLTKKHPLIELSFQYMLETEKWLNSSSTDKALKEIAQEWIEDAGSSPYDKTDYEGKALEIKDLLEVVGWYYTLIRSKMRRAITGYHDEIVAGKREPAAAIYPHFSDAAGTAKLVLVSIERSIAAWSGLLQRLKSEEGNIFKFLILLQKMQRGLKKALPDAEQFRRPGFDTGPNIFDEE